MSTDFNFYDIWKDFYTKSSGIFDEKIREDFPSERVGQILEMNVLLKKMIDETTEKYLEFVNVPTRSDLADISTLIVNLDAKVDGMEESLEETNSIKVDVAGFQRELAALKKDMKNFDTKLNQILSLLKLPEGSK